jgi:hypothetical protein
LTAPFFVETLGSQHDRAGFARGVEALDGFTTFGSLPRQLILPLTNLPTPRYPSADLG